MQLPHEAMEDSRGERIFWGILRGKPNLQSPLTQTLLDVITAYAMLAR